MKLLKIFKKKTNEEKVLLYLNKANAIIEKDKKCNSKLMSISGVIQGIINKIVIDKIFHKKITEDEITSKFLFNLRDNKKFKKNFEKAKNNLTQRFNDVIPLIELDNDCLKSKGYQRFLIAGRSEGINYIHTTNRIKEAKVLLELASKEKIENSDYKHIVRELFSDDFKTCLKKTNVDSIDYLIENKNFKIVFSSQENAENRQVVFMDLAVIDERQKVYSIDDFTDYLNEFMPLYEKAKGVAVESEECLYEKILKQISRLNYLKNKTGYGVL